MTETISIENVLSAEFENWIAKHFSNDSLLKQTKLNAIEKFKELGLPQKKSEAYKYTQIQRVLSKNFDFTPNTTATSLSKEDCQKAFYEVKAANHLVFINGSFAEDYSLISSDSTELTIKVLDEKCMQEHQEAQALLGKTRNIESDPFAALNLAFFNQGAFLQVHKNKDAKDVFIYHFIDSGSGQTIVYPRILVDAETGSRINIYEKTIHNGSENTLNISIFEGNVKNNAEVRYTKLQQYATNVFSIEGIYASQFKDSRFYTNTYTFKGGLVRNNIYINILGENSEAHMNGLYQISGKTHVDNNTSVDHTVPNCYSNELYKGILDESSKGVFNGKIYVRPDAQKTNAFQSNNNIILTDQATVNTKPQLEIWADDVQCSHGCTTGQLDEEAIFYLRSRGIDKKSAKALMLNAFANETLVEVKSELVTREIEDIILNKLG